MRRIRQRLGWLAGVWLACQAATLVGVSASLCIGGSTLSIDQECTCDHGDGQSCPMHHPAQKPKSNCSCRSTTDQSTAVVRSLFGAVADVPRAIEVADPDALSGVVPVVGTSPLDTRSVPDAPPPRS